MENAEQLLEKYWFLAGSKNNIDLCKNDTEKCCLLIEDSMHFFGIVATALYRESKIQTQEIEHTIFLSFERSFFGSWLYIMRKIGELWHYQNYAPEFFSDWHKFFAKYAYDNDLILLSSNMLRFRNDCRHGGMVQNETTIQSIWQGIQTFLASTDFVKDYEFSTEVENNNNTENTSSGIGVSLVKKNNTEQLKLFPFVAYNKNEKKIIFQNVGKDKENFYLHFGVKSRYELFLQQKEGSVLLNTPHLFELWSIHAELKKKLEEIAKSFTKILLLSPPGGGKTTLLGTLKFSGKIICSYLVEDSPLKIKPFTALKTILHSFSTQLQHDYLIPKNVAEGIHCLQKLSTQFSNKKFVIAIDGLFSPFCQSLFDHHWLDILNSTYGDNVTWIISVTTGTTVPRFFDIKLDIPPITHEEWEKNFPGLDSERVFFYSEGIPVFAQQYILHGKNHLYNHLYWEKYYQFFVKEEWQKKLFCQLANTSTYLSIIDLATYLEIFTPKVEKFIHEIKILLKKNEHGYTLGHSLFRDYIRRKVS